MKTFLLAMMLGLMACSHSTGPAAAAPFGWRYAGLQSVDPDGKGQFDDILAVGHRLFVHDGQGHLWNSTSYSSGWVAVPVPVGGGFINAWATDGKSLYLGTLQPGKVYVYSPDSSHWTDLGLAGMDTSDIYGVSWYRGHLVVTRDNHSGTQVKIRNDTGWLDWSTGYSGWGPYRLLPVGDTLWATTYESDPWFRVWGEPAWKQLPAMKFSYGRPILDTDSHPRGIAHYKGDIWIGWYFSNMSQLVGGKLPYKAYRNCLNRQPDGCKDLPLTIYTVISFGNHLFVGGFWPESGYVLDDASGKFMPLLDGWCWDNYSQCGGTTTWNYAGIGDTLYAAGNYRIMKYPLSDLPQVTAANKALWGWPPDSVNTTP